MIRLLFFRLAALAVLAVLSGSVLAVATPGAAEMASLLTVADTTEVVADTAEVAPERPPAQARRGAPQIVEVSGPRELEHGEVSTYRVRLGRVAILPVHYFWDFGAGTAALGNTVTLDFPMEGEYQLTVVARNRLGVDTASVAITVLPPPPPPVVAEESQAAGPSIPAGAFTWVVAARLAPDEALAEAARYGELELPVFVQSRESGERGEVAFVAVGAYETEAEALAERPRIEQISAGPIYLIQTEPDGLP